MISKSNFKLAKIKKVKDLIYSKNQPKPKKLNRIIISILKKLYQDMKQI